MKKRKFKKKGKFWVYIVECKDKTYYAGYTVDLRARLECHNDGLASKYTRARLPVRFVWMKEYDRLTDALKAEIAIKSLTRSQKEALVNGLIVKQ
jgi:putative endonuclease